VIDGASIILTCDRALAAPIYESNLKYSNIDIDTNNTVSHWGTVNLEVSC
jgi:hypothetical protein